MVTCREFISRAISRLSILLPAVRRMKQTRGLGFAYTRPRTHVGSCRCVLELGVVPDTDEGFRKLPNECGKRLGLSPC